MRAILIAPDLADKGLLVQELEHTGELQDIYASLDCSLIDTIRLDEQGNVMYVDDEGYMNKNTFFLFGLYPMPIAGRGLILGTDMTSGESQSTTLNLALIENIVGAISPAIAYLVAKDEDERRQQDIKDSGNEKSHIYISVSEIMSGAWYSDQLGLE
jgi:hypothetical protein